MRANQMHPDLAPSVVAVQIVLQALRILSNHLTVGQQMDAPIGMKINGLWKDVYCKMVEGTTDDDIKAGDVFTLLTLMDIPRRQWAMEVYEAEKSLFSQP
tara:strand:+ start:191 stop:490 length:300 start_codon:yes stop_codon:yes gene_type:complete